MAYTVLARRYRSGTFDEVVGQAHVAQTLKRAIETGRIAHAYLFCGTRGTGKTSMARILAKALNCEKSDAPTTVPCGKCESCLGIARGDDIDVIEIDAASNTGVDNVRGIIENSSYRPARSRFKVYIIDEVHMLSKSAFNALLKTLEEPPGHVKFILATTEPEKVLQTILSRCQRYDFRNIPTREIAAHLAGICKHEKIAADEDALLLVAKAGAGSMRDSLSLLDRLLSAGEQRLSIDMIEQLLGLPKAQLIFELAQAIGSGDTKAVLTRLDAMVQSGQSVDGLLAALVDHLRNLLILNACGPDSALVEVPGLALAELASQAKQFDPSVLTQDIVILEELRRQVRVSQAGRALLDATLVRLAMAEQFASVADLLARVDGAATAPTAAPAQKKKLELSEPLQPPLPPVLRGNEGRGEGDGNALSSTTSQNLSTLQHPPHRNPPPGSTELAEVRSTGGEGVTPSPPAEAASTNAAGVGAADEDDDLPRPGKVWDNSGPSLSELLKQQQAPLAASPEAAAPPAKPQAAPESNVAPVGELDLPAMWKALLELIAKHGPGLHGLLCHGQFVGIEDGRAVVRYAKSQESLVRMLDRNGKKDVLREAFSQLLNQSVGVKFEIEQGGPAADAAPATQAPAAQRPQQQHARPAAATAAALAAPPGIRLTPELRDKLESDPLIRAVVELGGNIVKVE